MSADYLGEIAGQLRRLRFWEVERGAQSLLRAAIEHGAFSSPRFITLLPALRADLPVLQVARWLMSHPQDALSGFDAEAEFKSCAAKADGLYMPVTLAWLADTIATTGSAQPVEPAATQYDIFICHASEDKTAVVVPLVEELVKRGLRVWVDYRELCLGDRLRQRVDEGLANSRFGVVVVSPSFFAKRWPQSELDGLVALEMADGKKRILPIWHEVEHGLVAAYSPMLAGRLAVKWNEGLDKVADEISRVVA
jgi:hypothetical protein